jgi:tetratricopeptide (TPR) repeat protein
VIAVPQRIALGLRSALILTVLASAFATVSAAAAQRKKSDGTDSAASAPVPGISIAIVTLENRNPLLESNWISSATVDLLTAYLSRNPALSIPERSTGEELARESALGSGAAGVRGSAADFVLGGFFSAENDQLRMDLNLTSRDGKTLWSDSFAGPLSTYSTLCRQAARAVTLALNTEKVAPELEPDAPPPISAAVSYYRGKRALERGDMPHALTEFMRATKAAPAFAPAWHELGETLEATGYKAAAFKAYEHAVDVNTNQPDAARNLFELGRLAEDMSDRGTARRVYQRLQTEFPFAKSSDRDQNYRPVTYAALAAGRIAHMDKMSGASDEQGVSISLPTPAARAQQDFANQFRRTGTYAKSWPAARLTTGGTVSLEEFGVPILHQLEGRDVAKYIAFPVLPADPAMPFEFIEVSGTCEGSDVNIGPLGAFPAGMTIRQNLRADNPNEPGVFQMTLQPPLSSGFYLRVRATQSAKLKVSAKCRKINSGSLRVESTPSGATVQIWSNEFGRVGVTPCLIRDLEPANMTISIHMGELLRGESNIDIAAKGETRVIWPIPAGADFQNASLNVPVVVREGSVDDVRDVCAAWHPMLGWIAAWTEDGDAFLARSADGVTWAEPQRVGAPIRSIAGTSLAGLLVAPNTGRTVLLFYRKFTLFASSSDDLKSWSLPKALFKAKDNFLPVLMGRGAVSTLGHFLLVIADSPGAGNRTNDHFQKPEVVAIESLDGVTWSAPMPSLSELKGPCVMSATSNGQFLLTSQWSDGSQVLRRGTADGITWSDMVATDQGPELIQARWNSPESAALLILAAQRDAQLVIPQNAQENGGDRRIKISGFGAAWSQPAAGESPRAMLLYVSGGRLFAQLSRPAGVALAPMEPFVTYEKAVAPDPIATVPISSHQTPQLSTVLSTSAKPVSTKPNDALTDDIKSRESKIAAVDVQTPRRGFWLGLEIAAAVIVLLAGVAFVVLRKRVPATSNEMHELTLLREQNAPIAPTPPSPPTLPIASENAADKYTPLDFDDPEAS